MNRVSLLIVLLHATLIFNSVGCAQPSGDGVNSDKMDAVARALLSYKDQYHSFPPVLVIDRNDTPLHSWRVLILPFLEANSFAEEYDFSTPWNSEKNIDLVEGTRRINREKFPTPSMVGNVYSTASNSSSYRTDIFMLVDSKMRTEHYSNGLPQLNASRVEGMYVSNPVRLVLIEVKKSDVHWMEPRDVATANADLPSFISIEAIKDQIVGSAEINESTVIRNRLETIEFLGF